MFNFDTCIFITIFTYSPTVVDIVQVLPASFI